MALDEAGWEALRAEYRTTMASLRALARKYDVDESTIREKRRKRPEDWNRDPRVAQAVQDEGHLRTLEGAVRARVLDAPPHTPPHLRGRARGAGAAGEAAEEAVGIISDLVADARAAIEEVAADAQADLLARANLDHLTRTQKLKEIFTRHAALLAAALEMPTLTPVADGSTNASLAPAQSAALAVLTGQSRSDTLAGHMQAAVAMAEKIQMQERRALGMDQGPKKLELSGPGGGPIESTTKGEIAFDPTKLSTEQLAVLYEAGCVLAGSQERPPVPLPPADPEPPLPDEGPPQA